MTETNGDITSVLDERETMETKLAAIDAEIARLRHLRSSTNASIKRLVSERTIMTRVVRVLTPK